MNEELELVNIEHNNIFTNFNNDNDIEFGTNNPIIDIDNSFNKHFLKKSKSYSGLILPNNRNNFLNNNNNDTQSLLQKSYKKKSIYTNLKLKFNKFELLNKLLSIFFHISIMISFEIFFYFNYIIYIEKNEFIKKINQYFSELQRLDVDQEEKLAIDTFFQSDSFQDFYNKLYINYKNSSEEQSEIIKKLILKSCLVGLAFYIIFIIIFIYSCIKRKKIKWFWISFENILMFMFLGLFEYIFFTQIIMNYNPLSDDEIKYYIINNVYNHLS